MPETVRAGLAETKSLELNPSFLHVWQGPNPCSHRLLPSRLYNSRKLELDANLGTWIWDVVISGGGLIAVSNVYLIKE